MIPWGAIVSLAGQAASGIMSARNNKQSQEAADREYARRKAHMEYEASQNPLERSDSQAVIAHQRRQGQEALDRAQASSVITGATPESVLAVQKANADALSDTMETIYADSSKRRDYYNSLAEQAREDKYKDDQARLEKRNETAANLASNAASAFGGIVDSYTDDTDAGSKEEPKPQEETKPKEEPKPQDVVGSETTNPNPTQSPGLDVAKSIAAMTEKQNEKVNNIINGQQVSYPDYMPNWLNR